MKKTLYIFLLVVAGFLSNTTFGQTYCVGDTVCLNVTARGAIQWQNSTNAGANWNNLTGETNDTLCFTVTGNSWYRAEITEGTCNPIYSDTAFINLANQIDTFFFTGAQQMYIVPSCTDSVHIVCYGASGGTATNNSSCTIGGKGGHAEGDLSVQPGDTLYVYVGEEGKPGNVGGWNGGGTSCAFTTTCAKGGGGSDVRVGGTTFNDRVIVAGGGGGAEWSGCSGFAGDGGGLTGGDGAHPTTGPRDGRGGTQTAGGAGGTGSYNGSAGTFGVGGAGGTHPSGHSGSGGGGWYGGGGSAEDGHAGGGSSYIGGVNNGVTNTGQNTGDGYVIIRW